MVGVLLSAFFLLIPSVKEMYKHRATNVLCTSQIMRQQHQREHQISWLGVRNKGGGLDK